MNIGDGHVISVTKANFGSTRAAAAAEQLLEVDRLTSISSVAVAERAMKTGSGKSETELLIEQRLRAALPVECLAGINSVTLLSNVYNPSDPASVSDPNVFVDLEVQ